MKSRAAVPLVHLSLLLSLMIPAVKSFRPSLTRMQRSLSLGFFFQKDTCRTQSRLFSTTDEDSATSSTPVWNSPHVQERVRKQRKNNKTRFRQHVNPLARQYQQPTLLSEDWPKDTYDDCTKPLHLDIGCGKGGFLLNMTSADEQAAFNYLGLEIRPGVAQFAKERIAIHGHTGKLDFIGCNANVDLRRILTRYQDAQMSKADLKLKRVSIQFPDPHFKAQHAKRRVVTSELIKVLAEFMEPETIVFLQSDVQNVLDDMRMRFREYGSEHFVDTIEDDTEYLKENIFSVPTEREVSVLVQGLPVYRALFRRNQVNSSRIL